MMRGYEWAATRPWAITEEGLQLVLSIASRDNESVEAVEAKLGRKLDNTRTVKNRDGVAVLPVSGPIFRYADAFTEISGATSVDTLALEFNAALDDPNIHSIILNINSPGGQVDGIHEFANMVYNARGQKNIAAYVGGMGASAAYWIASAADTIVADNTAILGSIGVIMSVPDPAKRAKDLQFVSGKSPKKRLDPTTTAGQSAIQAQLDALYSVFAESVARNRGVSTDKVENDYGQGSVMIGQAAVDANLADSLGSLETLIQEMSAAAAATKEKGMSVSVMSRLRAVLNGKPAAVEPEEESNPELDAALAEIEQLRAKAAIAEKLLAEKAEAEAKEKSLRIDAEVSSFMEKHGTKFGKGAAERFSARLKAAKASGDTIAIADLEAVANELPPVGPTNRLPAGGPSPEEIAAKVTPVPENEVGRTAAERLKKRGVVQGSAAWAAEYSAEVAKIRAEGSAHETK